MSREHYKGFELEPSTLQLTEKGEWTIGVLITRIGTKGEAKEFSLPTTGKTHEEAVKQSLQWGKQIVDGKVPECTVSDL